MKKNDWILAAGIILAAALILVFQLVRDDGGQNEVAVTVDGESIICLPNVVVVSVRGGEEAELDGVVQ